MPQTTAAMFPEGPTDLFGRVQLVGSRVGATEAAAFETLVGDAVASMYLRMLFHIRPGSADEETIHAAREAFAHIIGDCIYAEQEQSVQVSSGDPRVRQQFCVVLLDHHRGVFTRSVAFICWCDGKDEARRVLTRLQAESIFA